jgi:hypothetical protein
VAVYPASDLTFTDHYDLLALGTVFRGGWPALNLLADSRRDRLLSIYHLGGGDQPPDGAPHTTAQAVLRQLYREWLATQDEVPPAGDGMRVVASLRRHLREGYGGELPEALLAVRDVLVSCGRSPRGVEALSLPELLRELQQVPSDGSPPADGPVPPDGFRYRGRVAEGLSAAQYKLLMLLWDQKGTRPRPAMPLAEAGRRLCSRATADKVLALMALVGRTQARLDAAAVPLSIDRRNGTLRLTPAPR